MEKAIKGAIEYCIQQGIMSTFLDQHGSEIRNMLLKEWDMEGALEVAREEGHEEGIKQKERSMI